MDKRFLRRLSCWACWRAFSITPRPVRVLMRDPAETTTLVFGSGTRTTFFGFSDLKYCIPPSFGNRGTYLASTCLEVFSIRRLLISTMLALRICSSFAISALLRATTFWYIWYQLRSLRGRKGFFSQPGASTLINCIQISLSCPQIWGDQCSISLCAAVVRIIDWEW